jgi:hypothetical protein
VSFCSFFFFFRHKHPFFLLFQLALWLLVQATAGTTLLVSSIGTPGPCTSAARCDFDTALTNAAAGDTISVLADAPYVGCARLVSKTVTIIGEGGVPVFVCDTAANVFEVLGNVSLVDLRFSTSTGASTGVVVRAGGAGASFLRVVFEKFTLGLTVSGDNVVVDGCSIAGENQSFFFFFFSMCDYKYRQYAERRPSGLLKQRADQEYFDCEKRVLLSRRRRVCWKGV